MVEDGEVRSVEVTPEAERLGLTLAMPEVMAMARPARAGRAQTTVRIPIAGRAAWLRASRSA